MARIFPVPAAGQSNESHHEAASTQLLQVLSRLQQNVLHPTPERERRLRSSEFERARVEANLDYARSLLVQLEQEATVAKPPAQRLGVLDALSAHREALETLMDRLEDLRQHMAVDEDDSSDVEELLGDLEPTAEESKPADTREEIAVQESAPGPLPPEPIAIPEPGGSHRLQDTSPTTTERPVQAPTQTTQSLRARYFKQMPTATSHSTARATLFANRGKPAAAQASTATAEAILDHQRVEQDVLSDSILKMAGALKESSQRFSMTLEADKDVVSRAGEGMEKTERGMEAASGRMGILKRMTEGKGWWGRMILYAWVYGLMVALVLLVFVMPKLRF